MRRKNNDQGSGHYLLYQYVVVKQQRADIMTLPYQKTTHNVCVSCILLTLDSGVTAPICVQHLFIQYFICTLFNKRCLSLYVAVSGTDSTIPPKYI